MNRATKNDSWVRNPDGSLGFKYQPRRFGKPDFVHLKWRWVVFIDGCFWHGCPLHCRIPKSNSEYWRKRIERTRARDAKVTAEYEKGGWRVFRVWEHDINAKGLAALMGRAK